MSKPATPPSPILLALAQASSASRPSQVPDLEQCYCGEGRASLDALEVEVGGHGSLSLPLDAAQAQALHESSSPAHYGQREQTLLDRQVRDTGAIPAERLRLRWQPGAQEALAADAARALGLPALRLALHNLLVYGPGQFFKPHQDTEKHKGMIGTLVLVWPSAHIGGELRIEHGKQEHAFGSQHLQARDLRWVAFYADCRHEVRPVIEGWRVVLTFDLLLPQNSASSHRPPASPALLAALRAWFASDGDDASERIPLVFLLEHQYSEHGLHWSLIKGADRPHVDALRAAAHELGLVAQLALAEIHESWTADYEGYDNYGREPRPVRGELIEDGLALDFWVGEDGRTTQGRALSVPTDATIGFTETDDAFLVDEEYQGYMGNEGETLDYWYRRAALVLQTQAGAHVDRFQTDPDRAMAEALALARNGEGPELATRLQAAWPGLRWLLGTDTGHKHWAACTELASALPDARHALELCAAFDWSRFGADDAPLLAGLEAHRGKQWMATLLQAWTQERVRLASYGNAGSLWPATLRDFARACRDAGLSPASLQALLGCCVQAVASCNVRTAELTSAERQSGLARRIDLAGELAGALAVLESPEELLATLLGQLRRWPALYPLLALRPLLERMPATIRELPHVRALHGEVVQALHEAVHRPLPTDDDFSMDGMEWSCHCEDCSPMIAWAQASRHTPLVLSMAKARREHVEEQVRAAAAPFAMETIRQGSPHKLVLRKPDDLPARRRARHDQWRKDLAALMQA